MSNCSFKLTSAAHKHKHLFLMSLRLSYIEIMCNAIVVMASWWVYFLAYEEEINEEVMNAVGFIFLFYFIFV